LATDVADVVEGFFVDRHRVDVVLAVVVASPRAASTSRAASCCRLDGGGVGV